MLKAINPKKCVKNSSQHFNQTIGQFMGERRLIKEGTRSCSFVLKPICWVC